MNAVTTGHTAELYRRGLDAQRRGDDAEAHSIFLDLIAVTPSFVGARRSLGILSARLGRLHDALVHLTEALRLAPSCSRSLVARAWVLRRLGRDAEAIADARAAVAVDPTSLDALEAVAASCTIRAANTGAPEDVEAAVVAHHAALNAGADVETTRFSLAALGAAKAPARPPASYVSSVFDGYAPAFDEHMSTLGYTVPGRLAGFLARHVGTAALDMADLGCGTGLSGQPLRTLACRLVGVDLSSAMLAAAEARGCYDALHQADVIDYLSGTPESFDVLAAADLMPYLGDLNPLLTAAHRVIRPGGLLVASTERHDGEGFALQPCRRYSHSANYVADSASRRGFDVMALEASTLRTERGRPVRGWLMALGRRATAIQAGTKGTA